MCFSGADYVKEQNAIGDKHFGEMRKALDDRYRELPSPLSMSSYLLPRYKQHLVLVQYNVQGAALEQRMRSMSDDNDRCQNGT
jgi:hypothetical protein